MRPAAVVVAVAALLAAASGLRATAIAETDTPEESAEIAALLEPRIDGSLASALEALREHGLPLVYSTRLVRPELRLLAVPRAIEPRLQVEEILRPHGLGLRTGPGGRWIVVPSVELPTELAGVVRSRDDGAPIAGVTVVLVGSDRVATTDAAGRFRFEGLAPGSYDLEARHPAHVVERRAALELPRADPEPLLVELVRGVFRGEPLVVQPSRYTVLKERPTGELELGREEILSLPHLGDDIFRALELLPGIASNDLSAEFHVRGGRRDEVLVLLDGQELFEAFHLPEYDNALSLVTATGLSSVSLTTGAFPAVHGDRMGGVLEMETVEPPATPSYRLAATLLDLEASGSRRFADGRGSWFAAARRGTAELARELLADERPEYRDLFAKVEWRLASRHALGLRWLTSSDRLRLTERAEDEAKQVATDHDVSYLWLTHRAVLSDVLLVETVASTSATDRARSNDDFDDERTLRVLDRRDLEVLGLKQSWHLRTPGEGRLLGGFEWRRFESDFDYEREREFETPLADLRYDASEGSFRFRSRSRDEHLNLHLSQRLRPVGRLTLEAGVRYDEHTLGNEGSFDPRLNLSWALDRRGVLRLGWGRFHQSHRTYELRVEDGEVAYAPIERSEHRVLGYERLFERPRRAGLDALRVELFRRSVTDPRPRFENLLEPFDPFPEGESDRVRFAPEASRAEGVELFLKAHAGERLDGWVGYTWSTSEDRIEGRVAPRLIDQAHALTLDLNWRISHAWTLNLAWLFHTGRPTTSIGLRFEESAGDAGGDEEPEEEGEAAAELAPVPVRGPLNGQRLADYHRLDLRLSRRVALSRSELTLFVDVQNLYDRANLAGYSVEYDDDAEALRFDEERWPGFLASAGVAWRF